jgi:prohead serine protease
VLGVASMMREDETGAAYEVPLLDTSYNHDLIPGLRAGAYGASFRFAVLRETIDQQPAASSYNQRNFPNAPSSKPR